MWLFISVGQVDFFNFVPGLGVNMDTLGEPGVTRLSEEVPGETSSSSKCSSGFAPVSAYGVADQILSVLSKLSECSTTKMWNAM